MSLRTRIPENSFPIQNYHTSDKIEFPSIIEIDFILTFSSFPTVAQIRRNIPPFLFEFFLKFLFYQEKPLSSSIYSRKSRFSRQFSIIPRDKILNLQSNGSPVKNIKYLLKKMFSDVNSAKSCGQQLLTLTSWWKMK